MARHAGSRPSAESNNQEWWEPIANFFAGFNNPGVSGYHVGQSLGEMIAPDVSSGQSVFDSVTEGINDHGLDEHGNIDVNPADPTSSASNVIEYDPNKSAMDNMLGYAQANNSASAYNDYLQTLHNTEMSNSAISRAIADAEANGISKYQLFQSGNAAASTPSSGSSLATSYENAMNRRESWNEKELSAIVKIVTATISSAFGVLKKI